MDHYHILQISNWDSFEERTFLNFTYHYTDVIMGTVASQITSLTIVHSPVYSDADLQYIGET